MSTLQLSPSITVTTPDGTRVEFATLVIPDDAWDLDDEAIPGRWSSPGDRAIIAAHREGWTLVALGADLGFVDELGVTVLTFWRKVQA
jgi:hypothetical protein